MEYGTQFKVNDIVVFTTDYLGIKKGTYAQVIDVRYDPYRIRLLLNEKEDVWLDNFEFDYYIKKDECQTTDKRELSCLESKIKDLTDIIVSRSSLRK